MRLGMNQLEIATHIRRASLIVGLLIPLFLHPPTSWATDTFVLHNGGTIKGQWLNYGKPAQQEYHIRTTAGARLNLARSQVKRTIRVNPIEVEYQKLRHSHPDTTAGHWAIAEWCKENHLRAQRLEHLRQLLIHDHNHEEANLALGNALVHGEWLTLAERKAREGKVHFEGRWLTSQQVDIMKRERGYRKSRKAWAGKLENWRENLFSNKPERARLAREGIRSINDPAAVWALADRYIREPVPAVKLVYLEVAAKLKGGNAEKMLLVISLIEPDPEMRNACLDLVIQRQPKNAIEFYVKALRDKNNVKVNRAAFALTRFKDDSVVSPLIDALVTVHPVVSGNPHRSPDTITSTFNPDGGAPSGGLGGLPSSGNNGTGLTAGDQTKIAYRRVTNQTVLKSLIMLTGTNFDFNQEAWRNWLAVRDSQSPEVRGRRD